MPVKVAKPAAKKIAAKKSAARKTVVKKTIIRVKAKSQATQKAAAKPRAQAKKK
jgi:hypothetical protein